MKKHAYKPAEAGFTLVELMVVIVIIGLLSTFVVLNVLPSQDKAMTEKAKADVMLLTQAVEMYRLDNLSYPTTAQGLVALSEPPENLAQPERYRKEAYVRRLPKDPWGADYQYVAPGEKGPFDIYSLGANRKLGGEGLDADIGNWN
jgi:general secretion pathway protein G